MSTTRVRRMGRFSVSEQILTELLVDFLGIEGVQFHSVSTSPLSPTLEIYLVGDAMPLVTEGAEIPVVNVIMETVVKREYRTTVELAE